MVTRRVPDAGGARICGCAKSAAYDPAMLLAVDVGNSNVTLGSFRNGSARRRVRRAATPRDAHGRRARAAARGRCSGSTTRPSRTSRRSSAPRSCRRSAPRSRPSRRGGSGRSCSPAPAPCRIPIRVDRPGEVGADRLVNALAVARLYGTPAVVVDLGTATTFDCVAARWRVRRRRDRAGPRARARGAGLADREAARGSSCARPTGRSGGTRSRRSRAARSSATRPWSAGLLARIRRELADAGDVAPRRRPRRPDRRPVAARRGRARSRASRRSIPELTLKGLAILHAEVAGGQPLQLHLS